MGKRGVQWQEGSPLAQGPLASLGGCSCGHRAWLGILEHKCIYKLGIHPAWTVLSFMAFMHLIFHFLSPASSPRSLPLFPGRNCSVAPPPWLHGPLCQKVPMCTAGPWSLSGPPPFIPFSTAVVKEYCLV